MLFTPAPASAQFGPRFGLVTPVSPILTPGLSPYAYVPRYSYSYGARYGFSAGGASFGFSYRQSYSGFALPGSGWSVYPYLQPYQSSSYFTGGGNARPDVLQAAAWAIAKGQRDAALPGYGANAGSLSTPTGGSVTSGVVSPSNSMPPGPVAPDLSAIASGDALNQLLKDINRAEAKGARGQSPYIPALVLADLRFAGSPAADLLNLTREADNLPFPGAFDAPALSGLRSALDKDFFAIAVAVRAGKAPEPAKVVQLETTFGRVQAAVEPVLRNLSFEEATATRRFLNRFGSALKAAKDRSATGLIDPKWAAEGLTVADLVQHMTRYKLTFGQAPSGSEDAYTATHRNLAAYLYFLNQPKK